MSETALSKAIRKALDQMGVWNFRVQSGQIRAGARFIHCAPRGTPDIWCEHGWLEVKTLDGKLSKDQTAWHKKAQLHGVRVATVRSVAEAVSVVEEWIRDGR